MTETLIAGSARCPIGGAGKRPLNEMGPGQVSEATSQGIQCDRSVILAHTVAAECCRSRATGTDHRLASINKFQHHVVGKVGDR
ncbi:hypothetical protein ABZ468_08415 [Streptomyces sp. NPDC005708]|uniref:hypothetical protein n=1 Tax=Streptomyces sp. NPDC005708 TaxID=3154564 RepID=UPI0033D552A2